MPTFGLPKNKPPSANPLRQINIFFKLLLFILKNLRRDKQHCKHNADERYHGLGLSNAMRTNSMMASLRFRPFSRWYIDTRLSKLGFR